MQHMVMIVPVNAHVGKAQYVAEKQWGHRQQRIEGYPMRSLQFQHHDGDDDGNDAVAERFEPTAIHHRNFHFAMAPTTANTSKTAPIVGPPAVTPITAFRNRP